MIIINRMLLRSQDEFRICGYKQLAPPEQLMQRYSGRVMRNELILSSVSTAV
jgi:hypothetical protein